MRGGSPRSAIADCLGRHWLSVKCLLAKTKALPKEVIPERKKGSGHPAMIKSYALKVLERYLKKNPRSTARIVKQEVPEVACPLYQPPDSDATENSVQNGGPETPPNEEIKTKREVGFC